MIKKILAIGLITATLVGCAGSSGPEPSELSLYRERAHVTESWSEDLGNGQGGDFARLQPAVDETSIAVANQDGDLYLLDRLTGDERWHVDVDAVITGGVGLSQDVVVVALDTGFVKAFSRESGERVWEVDIIGEVLSQPTVYAGKVAIQTLDDRLILLEESSGEILWEHKARSAALSQRGQSNPVMDYSLVVAGFSSGRIKAFNIDDGVLQWEMKVGVPKGNSEVERLVDIDAFMLRDGDVLYAVAMSGFLVAVDFVTGRQLWSAKADSSTGLSVGLGNVYLTDNEGRVYAYDKRTGRAVWRNVEMKWRGLSSPSSYRTWVLVGDYEGYMHILAQNSGRTEGRYLMATRLFRMKYLDAIMTSGIQAPTIVYEDNLYTFLDNGELIAYTVEVSEGDQEERPDYFRESPLLK